MSGAKMKKLVPRSPQEVRELTVRDYADNVRRGGAEPDMQKIEKLVASDLDKVQAYDREVKKAPKPEPKPRQPRQSNELDRHLEQQNLRVLDEQRQKAKRRFDILDTPAHKVSPKWAHAMKRIQRIVQSTGDMGGAFLAGGLDQALRYCEYPILARMFFDVWIWYGPMRAIAHPQNPFYGMSDVDSARKFMRAVYDICDKSTAMPGLLGWWVK